MRQVYIQCLALLFISVSLTGQLEISEYSASNLNQFPDQFTKYEDWIEVHNTSSEELDISGFGISDKESKPQKWIFPEGTILSSGEYMIVWCSGRDMEQAFGASHTNFKLTQTKSGEYAVISDVDGNIIESTAYMQKNLESAAKILCKHLNGGQV